MSTLMVLISAFPVVSYAQTEAENPPETVQEEVRIEDEPVEVEEIVEEDPAPEEVTEEAVPAVVDEPISDDQLPNESTHNDETTPQEEALVDVDAHEDTQGDSSSNGGNGTDTNEEETTHENEEGAPDTASPIVEEVVNETIETTNEEMGASVELTLLTNTTYFEFDQPIQFVFRTKDDAVIIDTESHGVVRGFFDPLIDGIVDVSKAIVDQVVSIAVSVGESVSDIFSSDESEVDTDVVENDVTLETEDISVETPRETNDRSVTDALGEVHDDPISIDTEIETLPVIDAVPTGTIEEITDDTPGASSVAEEATSTEAIIEQTVVETGPIRVFVDGVEVPADIVWDGEYLFSVTITSGVLTQGAHTAIITYTKDETTSTSTINFIWGGEVVRTVVFDDVTHASIERLSEGVERLWFIDRTQENAVYMRLAEGEQLEIGSPVTLKDGNLLWLIRGGGAFMGYSILSKTFFSQTIEENPEADISFSTDDYFVTVEDNTFVFTESFETQ